MKSIRLFWILMVALLVPAMALNSCGFKRSHHYHDDDDDGSEKVEKKNKKKLDDIIGEYKLDEDGTLALLGENMPANDEVDYSLESKVYLKKNNKLVFRPIVAVSTYNEYVETTLTFTYKIESIGTWNYDKEQGLLTLEINDGKVVDFDLSYDEYTDRLEEAIDASGGLESVKESYMAQYSHNNFQNTLQLKVTDLNSDGFHVHDVQDNGVKFFFQAD